MDSAYQMRTHSRKHFRIFLKLRQFHQPIRKQVRAQYSRDSDPLTSAKVRTVPVDNLNRVLFCEWFLFFLSVVIFFKCIVNMSAIHEIYGCSL